MVPRQLEPTEPWAPASRNVYSHPEALRAPHFQGGPEAALEATDSLDSGLPSPGPEGPCAQRTAVGHSLLRFPRNLDTSGSKSDNI